MNISFEEFNKLSHMLSLRKDSGDSLGCLFTRNGISLENLEWYPGNWWAFDAIDKMRLESGTKEIANQNCTLVRVGTPVTGVMVRDMAELAKSGMCSNSNVCGDKCYYLDKRKDLK